MRRALLFMLLLCAPGPVFAVIPSTLGWYAIPSTDINNVCACTHGFSSYCATEGCHGITDDWCSAALDTSRNRLFVSGGGHNGYYGNEMYNLDLAALTMTRVNDPGTMPSTPPHCQTAYQSGTQPSAKHQYDALEYVPGKDMLWLYGGVNAVDNDALCSGVADSGLDLWFYHFSGALANQWERKTYSGTGPCTSVGASCSSGAGAVAAYDPARDKMWLFSVYSATMFDYDFASNTWTEHSDSYTYGFDGHQTMVYVPARAGQNPRVYVIGYGWQYYYDVSVAGCCAPHVLATTGTNNIVSNIYPGLDYDPVQDRLVGWWSALNVQQNTVYSLNLDTLVWTGTTYSGGPKGNDNGVFGRFRYVPSLNLFVLYTNTSDNGYTLRMTPATTSAPPTATITGPNSGNNVTVSTPTLTTLAGTAADDVAVTSVTWACDVCGSGTASGTTNWSVASITLQPGANVITVTAHDADGQTGADTITVTYTSTGADADFTARCTAPGVLWCTGFDTVSDVTTYYTFPAWDGTLNWAAQDTSQAVSGAGSLKFTISDTATAANTSGGWIRPFTQKFSQNSTFYVQYRIRLSPNLLTAIAADGWKTSIFYFYPYSCGGVELTTDNQYYYGISYMYTDCGATGLRIDLGGGDYLMQQGDYNCHYTNMTAPSCARWVSNQWMTMYYKVHVGTYGNADSSVEAWIGFPGDTILKKWIDRPNFTLTDNSASGHDSPTDGYDTLQLTPYNTSRAAATSIGTAYMWFDEVIVSTQPIAAPGGGAVAPSGTAASFRSRLSR